MMLQNPLGLWLLCGIPVVLIIFFIRLHHDDTSVSSTYIWRLSEKFHKKHSPLSKMKGLLSLILQILIIIAASLLISEPVVYNGNAIEHIVILDTSASMMTVNEKGVSRFDRAKSEILKLARKVNSGHTVTLITGADDPIKLIDRESDYGEIRRILDNVECGIGDVADHKIENAIQAIVDGSYYSKVYFYTDTSYGNAGDVNVVNVSENEWNVAISSLTYKKTGEGTVFTVKLKSYCGGGEFDLSLSVNGNDVENIPVRINEGEEQSFDVTVNDISEFEYATATANAKDGLAIDNTYSVCSKDTVKKNVLLISKSALYIKYALYSLGNCNVTHFMSLYGVELSGYDLYIFDHFYPETYPTDGSVFQMGTFVLPDGVSLKYTSEASAYLRINSSYSHKLHNGLQPKLASVKNYGVLFADSSWASVLTCNTNPVLVTKKLDSGHHFSLLSFDLHDSNFPLMTDFPIFIRNMVYYSVPGMLENHDFSRGAGSVLINVLPYCESITVASPQKEITELSPEGAVVSFLPHDVGIYTVKQKVGDESKLVRFFVHISESESGGRMGGSITVHRSSEPPITDEPAQKAILNVGAYAAALLLILLLAEWGVYYHDKY